MDFVYGHDQEIAAFIAQFSEGSSVGYGRCKAIGVVDPLGNLVAGMVYHNYNPEAGTIEFGVASITPHFFNRQVFRRMFEYPFIECGCQMLYSRISADNEYLLNIVARLNFNLTLIPRMYGRDADGVLATLTDDQWLDSKLARRVYRDVRREAA